MTPLGSPWPVTAKSREGALEIGGVVAEELAARFGTPLYVYDAATLRERARAYVDGVAEHPDAHVSFACKACCTVGVLRLLGELRAGRRRRQRRRARRGAARPASIPRDIVVHGNGKTDADIEAALSAGCGLLVLDSLDEGARVAAAAARHGRRQPVAVRVTPGIFAGGHEKIATGARGLEVRPRAGRRRAGLPRGARGPAARLARPARAPRLAGGRSAACSRASCAGSASSATRTRWSPA